MSDGPPPYPRQPRAPFHLFAIGLLLLLWNAWGGLLAITAQTGQLPVRPEDAAYFASQPLWFVLLADIAPFAGMAGAVALLLQAKSAFWLFALQIGVLLLSNGYELVVGSSIMLSNSGAVAGYLLLLVLLSAQIVYAYWLRKRGVLT